MAKRRTYPSLQAWMEGTGTNGQKLAKLAGLDPTHLSMILSGSRRCSLEKALRLHEVTGVPVENLVRWLVRDRKSRFERPVKSGEPKCA